MKVSLLIKDLFERQVRFRPRVRSLRDCARRRAAVDGARPHPRSPGAPPVRGAGDDGGPTGPERHALTFMALAAATVARRRRPLYPGHHRPWVQHRLEPRGGRQDEVREGRRRSPTAVTSSRLARTGFACSGTAPGAWHRWSGPAARFRRKRRAPRGRPDRQGAPRRWGNQHSGDEEVNRACLGPDRPRATDMRLRTTCSPTYCSRHRIAAQHSANPLDRQTARSNETPASSAFFPSRMPYPRRQRFAIGGGR